MTKKLLIAVACLCLVFDNSICCIAMEPSLAMADTEDTVTFKFISTTPCIDPVVNLKNIDRGTYEGVYLWQSDEYQTPGLNQYHRYSYFFRTKVIQGDTYYWSFRSDNELGPFQFKIRDLKTTKNPRFIQIADMEYSNNSIETFQALNQMDWRNYDGLIHAGDYAYDLKNDNGLRGERFFNALSNIMPSIPTMYILGNHENYDNGKLFNYRFRLPDYNTNMTNNFYSQVRGQVFFLFVNYDYYITWYKTQLSNVIAYLDEELKRLEALIKKERSSCFLPIANILLCCIPLRN